jgi:hypothetical protein
MGDCDLTYDFRELAPFVSRLADGYEFVMGSRFRGFIEPGAMPRLHRFFGTPVTTWILNRLYAARFSDIHCGMRAMRTDVLRRIDLESQSWEYASEMLIKAAKLKLRVTEVPVRFYRDREGRASHHKRVGWYSPWLAGWQNLKVMLLYAPDYFLVTPGLLVFGLGFLLSAILVTGPLMIGDLGLDLHWMLLGLMLSTLGYSAVQLGYLARVRYNFDPRFTERLLRRVSTDRGCLAAAVLVTVGVALNLSLVVEWTRGGFRLHSVSHPAIFGMLLIVLGFQTFAFTLLLHIIGKPDRRGAGRQ